MIKLILACLSCMLVACSTTAPRQSGGCINGDPGGSMACQAATYTQAF